MKDTKILLEHLFEKYCGCVPDSEESLVQDDYYAMYVSDILIDLCKAYNIFEEDEC